MDSEILDWVTRSLKEDQEGPKKKQTDRLTKLEDRNGKLQHRLDLMYEYKLDKRIDQEFYERKSKDWKEGQLKPNYRQPFGIIAEKNKICSAE